MNVDAYMKCISLNHNKITEDGIMYIAKIASEHPFMLSIDLRNNPGFDDEDSKENLELMKYGFLKNIRKAIHKYKKDETRMKLEWLYPNAIGIMDNDIVEK